MNNLLLKVIGIFNKIYASIIFIYFSIIQKLIHANLNISLSIKHFASWNIFNYRKKHCKILTIRLLYWKLPITSLRKTSNIYFSEIAYINLFDDNYVGDHHNISMENRTHLERKGIILMRVLRNIHKDFEEVDRFIFEICIWIFTFSFIHCVQKRNWH